MKKNISVVALLICICSLIGGIFYTEAQESLMRLASGRDLLESDFLQRFEYAYRKDEEYFQKLGINSISNSLGFTFQRSKTSQIITVDGQDPSRYMIGFGIKNGKPQVKYFQEVEANQFFNELAFPNIFTRAYKKWKITSRVFEIVGKPGN